MAKRRTKRRTPPAEKKKPTEEPETIPYSVDTGHTPPSKSIESGPYLSYVSPEIYNSVYQPKDVNFYVSDIESTGVALGGTIGVLDKKVQDLERLVRKPANAEQLSQVQNELASIKTDILPQLEESKQTLARVEKYMRENASFLMDLASSQGRLRAVEDYVSSLSKRIETLEGQRNVSWSKAINIITIIVSLVSISIAIYVARKP